MRKKHKKIILPKTYVAVIEIRRPGCSCHASFDIVSGECHQWAKGGGCKWHNQMSQNKFFKRALLAASDILITEYRCSKK